MLAAGRLVGIPTVPFSATSGDTLALASLKSLVVDTKYAEARDDRGATLIPPTLYEFAETFASDLYSVLGLNLSLSKSPRAEPDSIFLTLGDAADYINTAGSETSEGYTLSVASQGIEITGASPLGVWWATRTVLQQAILTGGEMTWGRSLDVPGWGTRGSENPSPLAFLPTPCSLPRQSLVRQVPVITLRGVAVLPDDPAQPATDTGLP